MFEIIDKATPMIDVTSINIMIAAAIQRCAVAAADIARPSSCHVSNGAVQLESVAQLICAQRPGGDRKRDSVVS